SFVDVNGIDIDAGVTLMLPLVRIGLSDPNTVPVDVNDALPLIVMGSLKVPLSVVVSFRPVKAFSMMIPPTLEGIVTPGFPSMSESTELPEASSPERIVTMGSGTGCPTIAVKAGSDTVAFRVARTVGEKVTTSELAFGVVTGLSRQISSVPV